MKHLYQLIDSKTQDLPILIWEVDSDGIILESHGYRLSNLGLAPNQLKGQCVFDIYNDRPDVVENIRLALSGQEACWEYWSEDQRYYKSVAGPIYNNENKLIGCVGISIDITESHIMSQKVIESEKKRKRSVQLYDKVADNIAQGIWILDEKMETLYTNKALEELLDVPKSHLLLHPVADYIIEEHRPYFKSQLEKLNSHKPIICDVTLQKSSGEPIDCHVSLTKLLDENKNEIGTVILVSDISDLKAKHQEISMLYKELSHRVKNNFQIINSLISLMAMEARSSETKESLNSLEKRIFALATAYNTMRNSSKDQIYKPCDYMNTLISDFAASFVHDKLISIECFAPVDNYPDKELTFDVLSTLGLIANELLVNTLKASSPSKPLTAFITSVSYDNHFHLVYFDTGDFYSQTCEFDHKPGLGLELIKIFAEKINASIEYSPIAQVKSFGIDKFGQIPQEIVDDRRCFHLTLDNYIAISR